MRVFDLNSEYAVVRVRGANGLDFLHRMSTGALAGLGPGQGARTVFTTPIGRMVDVGTVLARTGEPWLVCSAGARDTLMRWLRKYVFFNDDVQFVPAEALAIHGVFGAGADAWAEALVAGASAWPRHAHAPAGDALLTRSHPVQGAGWWIIGPPSAVDAALPVAPDPLAAYHQLRVTAGYAAHPAEVNQDFIPLEAGLWDAVSFSKGCYIGQEIIARMESRNQIARRLVRLEAVSATPGDRVYADGSDVGAVTSAADDLALGYVRAAAAVDGRQVEIGPERRPGRVAELARM